MKNRPVVLVLALLVLILFAPAGRAGDQVETHGAAPVITFDGSMVKASDIAPGSDVAFFALGLVSSGWDSEVFRWAQVVTDDDRDGVVTFDAGRAVPCKSIWVAAEVRNGHFAVSPGPGCPLRTAQLSPGKFKTSKKGTLEVFLHSRPYLDMLYVHPGKGVWSIEAADGYPTDADGETNGVTTIDLSGAKSVSKDNAPPPEAFTPGGILIAIDLYGFDVVAERLDGTMLGEVNP